MIFFILLDTWRHWIFAVIWLIVHVSDLGEVIVIFFFDFMFKLVSELLNLVDFVFFRVVSV